MIPISLALVQTQNTSHCQKTFGSQYNQHLHLLFLSDFLNPKLSEELPYVSQDNLQHLYKNQLFINIHYSCKYFPHSSLDLFYQINGIVISSPLVQNIFHPSSDLHEVLSYYQFQIMTIDQQIFGFFFSKSTTKQ